MSAEANFMCLLCNLSVSVIVGDLDAWAYSSAQWMCNILLGWFQA